MKKLLTGVVIIHLLLVSYAWKGAEYRREEIFDRLGITREQANDHIFRSLQAGRLYIPTSVISRRISLRSMLFDSKKQLIEDFGAYMKQYVLSEEFNTKYQQYRAKQAPQKQGDVDAGLSHIAEQYRKELNISEQMAAKAKTPEEKALYEKDVQKWKERLKPYEDKNSAAYAKEKKNAEALKNLFEMADKTKQTELDNRFPPEVKAMMKQRLESFLALSAGVDFNATLKEDSYVKGRKVFTNFFYEQKPADWKLCYRLGKETTDLVRAYARQWLQELK
jgi:hypothetical protein